MAFNTATGDVKHGHVALENIKINCDSDTILPDWWRFLGSVKASSPPTPVSTLINSIRVGGGGYSGVGCSVSVCLAL